RSSITPRVPTRWSNGFGRSLFSPLPVLRERVRVRVLFRSRATQHSQKNPHPCPLPEYRERGQYRSIQLPERQSRRHWRGTVVVGADVIRAAALGGLEQA